MKRKRLPPAEVPVAETVVPEVLMERARQALATDQYKKRQACVVCGSECAPNSAEGLCWVCRRLKLSAWRDNDTQMPAQE